MMRRLRLCTLAVVAALAHLFSEGAWAETLSHLSQSAPLSQQEPSYYADNSAAMQVYIPNPRNVRQVTSPNTVASITVLEKQLAAQQQKNGTSEAEFREERYPPTRAYRAPAMRYSDDSEPAFSFTPPAPASVAITSAQQAASLAPAAGGSVAVRPRKPSLLKLATNNISSPLTTAVNAVQDMVSDTKVVISSVAKQWEQTEQALALASAAEIAGEQAYRAGSHGSNEPAGESVPVITAVDMSSEFAVSEALLLAADQGRTMAPQAIPPPTSSSPGTVPEPVMLPPPIAKENSTFPQLAEALPVAGQSAFPPPPSSASDYLTAQQASAAYPAPPPPVEEDMLAFYWPPEGQGDSDAEPVELKPLAQQPTQIPMQVAQGYPYPPYPGYAPYPPYPYPYAYAPPPMPYPYPPAYPPAYQQQPYPYQQAMAPAPQPQAQMQAPPPVQMAQAVPSAPPRPAPLPEPPAHARNTATDREVIARSPEPIINVQRAKADFRDYANYTAPTKNFADLAPAAGNPSTLADEFAATPPSFEASVRNIDPATPTPQYLGRLEPAAGKDKIKPEPPVAIDLPKPLIENEASEPPPALAPDTKKALKNIPANIDAQTDKKVVVNTQPKGEGNNKQKAPTIDLKAATASYDSQYELEKAYNALVAGNSEAAIEFYGHVLEVEPTNVQALFGTAATYHQIGQLDKARPYYSRLLKVNPTHKEALNNFLALAAEEAPEEALNELLYLETRNPDFSPVPAQIAYIYQSLDRYDDAIEKMVRAVSLDPENLVYRYNLAILLDKQGKSEQAASVYQMLIDADRRGAEIPGNPGKIQERLTFLRSNIP